jgi:hypothetical protein
MARKAVASVAKPADHDVPMDDEETSGSKGKGKTSVANDDDE